MNFMSFKHEQLKFNFIGKLIFHKSFKNQLTKLRVFMEPIVLLPPIFQTMYCP